MPISKGDRLRLLIAASEVVGFAKTGGLADVAGSLPRALSRRGHQCAVILPLYSCARAGKVPLSPTGLSFTIPIGERKISGNLWQAKLPDSSVPVYLVEQPNYFERDDPAVGRGLYQFTLPNGQKRDYPDNSERFIFFSRAVLESMRLLDYWPDLVHNNDWQTGLVPVYLREEYSRRLPPDLRARYDKIRTAFTIHNIAYQGLFWHWDMALTGLDWRLFNYQQLEFYGRINFLKAGIIFSDILTTVSPSYAKEIQTPYYSWGLQGVLAERRDRLFGIVNGVDYSQWDPAIDRHLPHNYNVDTVAQHKPLCKASLQRRFALLEQPRIPLLGVVSRLVDQKGIDLVAKAAEALLAPGAMLSPPGRLAGLGGPVVGGESMPPIASSGIQLVVLGEGDPVYHRMLMDLKAKYPGQVGIALGFDEPLAHQIEGGADIFLMPSQFEPSGLNQLYSLKYGTVPVVRATGGLADTIVDYTPDKLATGQATGFTFVPYTAAALLATVQRALDLYHQQPGLWLRLMRNGMRQDWSWDRSAMEYEQLYLKLVKRK
jgi:starch synthase